MKKVILEGCFVTFDKINRNGPRPYNIDSYLLFKKNIIRKNKINKIFSL